MDNNDVDAGAGNELSLSEKIFDTGITGYPKHFATLAKEGSEKSLNEIVEMVNGGGMYVTEAVDALSENGSELAVELLGDLAVELPEKAIYIFETLARQSSQVAIDTIEHVIETIESDDIADISKAGALAIETIVQNNDALVRAENIGLQDELPIEDDPGALEM
ncbi:MAG: hypothetical protein ACRBCK_00955 [Alphaproteobacteria bacterium]